MWQHGDLLSVDGVGDILAQDLRAAQCKKPATTVAGFFSILVGSASFELATPAV
jgi:hypothetical protein